MIKEFSLLELRNAELLQFCNTTVELVESNDPTFLKVEPQLNPFKARIAEAEVLFILPRDSVFSAELQALDTQRDKNFKGINQVVQAYLKHYDPVIQNAANQLSRNIKLYGNQITRLNYQAQTSVIESIITDWNQKPELAEAIDLLHLKGWKDELKQNNTNFNSIYTQRTQEYGGRTQDKLRDKREEVAQAYLVLVQNINARKTLDETGMYNKVTNEINALIELYQTTLRNREARRDNDNEEDDTPSAE